MHMEEHVNVSEQITFPLASVYLESELLCLKLRVKLHQGHSKPDSVWNCLLSVLVFGGRL